MPTASTTHMIIKAITPLVKPSSLEFPEPVEPVVTPADESVVVVVSVVVDTEVVNSVVDSLVTSVVCSVEAAVVEASVVLSVVD